MSSFAWLVQLRQFLLEWFIEQGMPVMAQKHKEFRMSYARHKLLFLCGKVRWWLPKWWLHGRSPGVS
jgi:hypothetical protein